MWQCSRPFLPGKLSVQEGFMTKTWLSEKYLIGAVLAAGISAALVWATPESNFTLTPLQRSSTNDRIDIKTKPHQLSDILVQHITAEPGGYTGWHSHRGPGMVAVKAGVVALYSGTDPTCTPKYVTAGSAFVEEANHVHFVRNVG